MCLVAEKMKSFSNLRSYWSHLEFIDTVRMVGEPTRDIYLQRTMKWASGRLHRIERKHLQLRTRIKRLTRKTICFSKSELMHDLVIGLFINRYEFGLVI